MTRPIDAVAELKRAADDPELRPYVRWLADLVIDGKLPPEGAAQMLKDRVEWARPMDIDELVRDFKAGVLTEQELLCMVLVKLTPSTDIERICSALPEIARAAFELTLVAMDLNSDRQMLTIDGYKRLPEPAIEAIRAWRGCE